MKYWNIIIILTIFIYACESGGLKENDYPSLKRYVEVDNRSCDNIDAVKFQTIDSLLDYFYETAYYKDSFELNLRIGAFYYYKKQYDSSLTYYLKAKNIDSSLANIHFDIALAYSSMKRFDEALISINKALDICGPKWSYLNSKCYILSNLGAYEEAIKAGLISYNLNPENEKIYGNLLNCFDKIGERDSIRKYVDLAIINLNVPPERATKLKQQYNVQL
jgi:Flp pilus assembly protein TadD, contains TPR repeats